MEGGADVSAASGADGLTPLMIIAAQTSPAEGARFLPGSTRPSDIAKGLVERGADVNAQAKSGMTALMIAATHNNPPMIGLLMDAGRRSRRSRTSKAQTAADVAEKNGNLEAATGHHGVGLGPLKPPHPRRRAERYRIERPANESCALSRLLQVCRGRGVSRGPLASSCGSAVRQGFRRERRQQGGRGHVIAERSKDGAFVFHDPKLDADLNLSSSRSRSCAAWKAMAGSPIPSSTTRTNDQKKYAIDFWFKPDGDKLTLMDIRVQKGPKQEGDGWIMITRMPVAWWWLPVQEHPGDMEVTRAWQVMSAIHNLHRQE